MSEVTVEAETFDETVASPHKNRFHLPHLHHHSKHSKAIREEEAHGHSDESESVIKPVPASPARTRIILFLLVCIPVRIGLAVAAGYWAYLDKEGDPNANTWRWVLTALGFAIGIGFLYNYLRKNHHGVGFFGGPRYWHSEIHGALYLAFAILVLLRIRIAFVVLIIDIFIGVLSVLFHYTVIGTKLGVNKGPVASWYLKHFPNLP
nr:hypothetical protein [Sicyoidochytrium minutum DNA virus]